MSRTLELPRALDLSDDPLAQIEELQRLLEGWAEEIRGAAEEGLHLPPGGSALTADTLPRADANGDLVDSGISDDGPGDVTISRTGANPSLALDRVGDRTWKLSVDSSGHLRVRDNTGTANVFTLEAAAPANALVVAATNGDISIARHLTAPGYVIREDFICCLADNGGGITLPLTFVDIDMDTEKRVDDIYSHTGGAAAVTADEAGDYKVTADVAADVTGGTRHTGEWGLFDGSNVQYADTGAWTYHRTAANGEDSASITTVLTLSASDVVKIRGKSTSATAVTTMAAGCRLTIERL